MKKRYIITVSVLFALLIIMSTQMYLSNALIFYIPLAITACSFLLILDKHKSPKEVFILKLIIATLSGVAIAFISIILFFILLFGKLPETYAFLVLATGLFLIVLLPLTLFKVLRGRKAVISWGVGISFMVALVGGSIAYEYYDSSIPVMADNIYPTFYRPYNENIPLAVLDEAPAFTIESDFPRLDGATALYPLYAAFAKAVYPDSVLMEDLEQDIVLALVACSSTRHAYKSLVDKERDIIFVAGPSQGQIDYALEQNEAMALAPVGKEGFVFFVNAKNPVESLTIEQLKDIYSGKITNWAEVGGRNESIRAFQRNEGSGSQSAFLRFMGDTLPMKPPIEDYIVAMGAIIDDVSNYKNYSNSIGFSFRYFTQQMVGSNNIKLLKINGIEASEENIRSGNYPLTNQFYAISLVNNSNPNIAAFIEWMLSPQGQLIVEKTGYSRL